MRSRHVSLTVARVGALLLTSGAGMARPGLKTSRLLSGKEQRSISDRAEMAKKVRLLVPFGKGEKWGVSVMPSCQYDFSESFG